MSTRIILRSDIDKLGKRGDIVEVSDGHFRNYLRPRGLAIVATDGAVSQAAAMRRARDLRDAHDRESAQTVATALVAKTITIPVKAGGEGRLYGSVTSADIAAAIEEQSGITIDRKKLTVPAIKTTGEYQVSVKLHSAVEFPVTVAVTPR
jgi:large subunit ribosomal protein L9